MERIKYSCAKCGWEDSIIELWADLKPKRCLGKRCNTSFLREPEALLVEQPKPKEVPVKGKRKKREE